LGFSWQDHPFKFMDPLKSFERIGILNRTLLNHGLGDDPRVLMVTEEDVAWDVPVVVCGELTMDLYSRAFRKLAKGAQLFVDTQENDVRLISLLKLAGFTHIHRQGRFLSAKKPTYDLGMSVSLGSREANDELKSSDKIWQSSARPQDGLYSKDHLIDEEALLEPPDRVKPAFPIGADCKPEIKNAPRKACKNCTCGRAEQEAANTSAITSNIPFQSSSCGNCSLGDAFRCGGCPYRGLPPFKPGEIVVLRDLTEPDI
jgi:hypothetical protein